MDECSVAGNARCFVILRIMQKDYDVFDAFREACEKSVDSL